MVKDIIMFYYYSSPTLPEKCFLSWDPDIAYRNLLIFAFNNKFHFEFPVFEDHSYNSICNLTGVRGIIKRPKENEKYIIFRTKNQDTKKSSIVGYYKIGECYFQRTNLFNNYGHVWGIEASEFHLLKKDELEYKGPILRQGYQVSWHDPKWNRILNEILGQISARANIAARYKEETNRLISIFKNKTRISQWREFCEHCGTKCRFFRTNERYKRIHSTAL